MLHITPGGRSKYSKICKIWQIEILKNIQIICLRLLNWILISGQRESFFQSRDENESFSDSISFIETRLRITLTLRLRDETEKKFPPISGIETRSRFIIFTLRLRDENESSLDLISFFETRPRILKLAIFP